MICSRPFSISFLAAAAAACFATLPSCRLLGDRDLSRQAPYSAYVGKTVTLQRPMEIIGGSDATNHYATNDLVPPGEDHGPRALPPLATLHRNDRITIESVRWVNNFDWASVSAVGATVPNGDGERIWFEYTWGSYSVDRITLRRAPWEDASVPEKRFGGFWEGRDSGSADPGR